MSNDPDTFSTVHKFSKDPTGPFPASDYLRSNVPARRVCFHVFFNRGLSTAKAAAAPENPAPAPSPNDAA